MKLPNFPRKKSAFMRQSWTNWVKEKLDIQENIFRDIKLLFRETDTDKFHIYHDPYSISGIIFKPPSHKKQAKVVDSVQLKKLQLFPVTAFGTVNKYPLEKLVHGLKKFRVTHAAIHFKGEVDMIHAVKESDQLEPCEAFIFRNGAFVLWNFNEGDTATILKIIEDYQLSFLRRILDIELPECVDRLYYRMRKYRCCGIEEDGFLVIPESPNFHDKYAASCALATSVSLTVWQAILEYQTYSILENVTFGVQMGNRLSISERKIRIYYGSIQSIRYYMNTNSKIYRPIADEKQPRIDYFHKTLWIHFSIPRRIKILEKKLLQGIEVMDLIGLLYSYQQHTNSAILYYILSLITVLYSIISTMYKIQQFRIDRERKKAANIPK